MKGLVSFVGTATRYRVSSEHVLNLYNSRVMLRSGILVGMQNGPVTTICDGIKIQTGSNSGKHFVVLPS
jgi:hypothetical protein